MPLAYHFREKMLGPWETVRGFLVAEFDFLFLGLAPLSPLSDGLSTLAFAQTGVYPSTAILTTDAAGNALFTVGLPAPLQFQPQMTISPAVLLAGSVNNYNPAGFDTAAQVRLLGHVSGTTLTGMHGPPLAPGGLYKLLVNVGTPSIAIAHQSTSSSVGSRFNCPGSVTYTLPTNTAVWVWLDPLAQCWQIIGK